MTPEETITQFFAAWGETDADARMASLSTVLAPSAQYADPRSNGVLVGTDAIAAYIGQFSANAPGWTAEPVKQDSVAGLVRATVAFGGKGPDGADMIQHGQYFAKIVDGHISEMTGFVGTGALA